MLVQAVNVYISSRWLELGYSEEQARAYYDPDQASPESLQALEAGGLLRFDSHRRWTRLPGFAQDRLPMLSYRSPYQRIEVCKSGDTAAVYLNGTIQLEGRETRHHNEMMVALPLSVIPDPRRALILGGGFGMGAQVALEFSSIESIEVVEIDPDVLRLSQQSRSLRQLNHKSLLHPKVKVWLGDAFDFVRRSQDLYDLIVFDCDLTATRQSDHLEVAGLIQFFRDLGCRLRPGGGLSTRIPIDESYMELVDQAGEFDPHLPDVERAGLLVNQIWPQAYLFEFLSVYCGRELVALHFPSGGADRQPQIRRRLTGGSGCYQQVLDDLFAPVIPFPKP